MTWGAAHWMMKPFPLSDQTPPWSGFHVVAITDQTRPPHYSVSNTQRQRPRAEPLTPAASTVS